MPGESPGGEAPAPGPRARRIVIGIAIVSAAVGAGSAAAGGAAGLSRSSVWFVLFTFVWLIAVLGTFTERASRIWRLSALGGAGLALAHSLTWSLLWRGPILPLIVAPILGAACGAIVGGLWGLSKSLLNLWPLLGVLAGGATILLWGWVWLVLLVMAMLSPPFQDRGFDPVVWRAEAQTTNRDSPRGSMVGEILERVVKPGMARTEVRSLLGAPDWESPSPDEDHWRIGMWTGFRMDEDTLRVRYTLADRVRDADIVQH
ncbi:MAG: hypothetical protein L0216_19760 [Planctomycetales bacterium]|nr:hypothetical protein [Planctomycetales bacterium]